jgi:dihydropteridine reductase
MASAAKNVLVYGGGGALGRTVVSTFRKANTAVVNVDLVANDEASQNIVLAPSQSAHEQRNKVFAELEGVKGLDAVVRGLHLNIR